MKILLHICCAPCTIYPLRILREGANEVSGLFYNPNIHPYQEYGRRFDALELYAGLEKLAIVEPERYPLDLFIRQIAFREGERCSHCYRLRLSYAAGYAKRGRFDAFTTTLLYSRYQKHELIREIAEEVAAKIEIPFFYRDFRDGWSEGIRVSKDCGIYRQPYCGCIFSEKERYLKDNTNGKGRGIDTD